MISDESVHDRYSIHQESATWRRQHVWIEWADSILVLAYVVGTVFSDTFLARPTRNNLDSPEDPCHQVTYQRGSHYRYNTGTGAVRRLDCDELAILTATMMQRWHDLNPSWSVLAWLSERVGS